MLKAAIGRARFFTLLKIAQTKRVNQIKEKYPILSEKIDSLVASDPSGRYKYLDWQVKQLMRGSDVSRLISAIDSFHSNTQRIKEKDINQYSGLAELELALSETPLSNKDIKKKEKVFAYNTSDVILNSDSFLVVRPESREASCYFGRGTRWCISASESANAFESYSTDNIAFYFIINKSLDASNPLHKIAIAKGSHDAFYDATDEQITKSEVRDSLGKMADTIIDLINSHYNENRATKLSNINELTDENIIVSIMQSPQNIQNLLALFNNRFFIENVDRLIKLVDAKNLSRHFINIYLSSNSIADSAKADFLLSLGSKNKFWHQIAQTGMRDLSAHREVIHKVIASLPINYLIEIYKTWDGADRVKRLIENSITEQAKSNPSNWDKLISLFNVNKEQELLIIPAIANHTMPKEYRQKMMDLISDEEINDYIREKHFEK